MCVAIAYMQACKKTSLVTHAHISGVNGSLLQGMAIGLALRSKPGELNSIKFVDKLMQEIAPFEMDLEKNTQNGHSVATKAEDVPIEKIHGQPSYKSKLSQIRALLTQDEPPSPHTAQKLLGHGVLAGI